MTNPFNRADKHGAPDMRPTAPPSAETPMQPPVNQTITLPSAMVPAEPPKDLPFAEVVEWADRVHITRGNPTYAELKASHAGLIAALESLVDDDAATNYCTHCGGESEYLGTDGIVHNDYCAMAAAYDVIAKAKGG